VALLMEKYFKKILTSKVYEVAKETPLDLLQNQSQKLGNKIYLKREDLQPVFSFKIRGAYNKMANLPKKILAKGVVTSSAGNHAQGVALAAKKLKCQALIVMPESTPQIKIDAVKNLGSKVILFGDTYYEAEAHAHKLATQKKLTFIHPYDDPDVIAGQGTIGMEILRQSSEPIDAVFVCVGGGGLASGIATYIKYLEPKIKVIAVEPKDSAAMYESIKQGKRVCLERVGGFADGVAVKQVGKETFKICKKLIDDFVLVDTDQICAAIKDVFEDTRTMLEPSGALGLAGINAYVKKHKVKGKNFVTIATGANINFHRLRHVSERAELGEQREAILAVSIPEKPGSFRALLKILGKRRITEFNYRRDDPGKAHVFMGIEIQDQAELKQILSRLKKSGFKATNLTDDEMCKLHLRHMVGGKAKEVPDEIFYRFEFPERAGALADFLNNLSPDWNISLFHYRNHGTDYGRVLVGLEVSSKNKKAFQKGLEKLGYKYWDETDNPACQLFLR
jgi:threonine dehydratase